MSLCICSFAPALYSPWEIMTTFRIICIHELCFEHKVKSPFPHNETFYDMITFTFQLMPCTMYFFFSSKSDQICHIVYWFRSFWPLRAQSHWLSLCLMLWSHGHLSSGSLRNSFKSLKITQVWLNSRNNRIGLLLNGILNSAGSRSELRNPLWSIMVMKAKEWRKPQRKSQQKYLKLKGQEVRAIPSEASTSRHQSGGRKKRGSRARTGAK